MGEDIFTTVHWLSDVDKLEVLCDDFKEGDKYTLEYRLITCEKCRKLKLEGGNDA